MIRAGPPAAVSWAEPDRACPSRVTASGTGPGGVGLGAPRGGPAGPGSTGYCAGVSASDWHGEGRGANTSQCPSLDGGTIAPYPAPKVTVLRLVSGSPAGSAARTRQPAAAAADRAVSSTSTLLFKLKVQVGTPAAMISCMISKYFSYVYRYHMYMISYFTKCQCCL